MPIVSMAYSTLLGEELWASGQRIVAQQFHRSATGYACRRLSQHSCAGSISLGDFGCGLISRVALVLHGGPIGKQSRAQKNAAEKTDVKSMAQFPVTKQGHQEDHAEHQGGND